MLDSQGLAPKQGPDSVSFAPKDLRPQRVVVHDLNFRRHLNSPLRIAASTLSVADYGSTWIREHYTLQRPNPRSGHWHQEPLPRSHVRRVPFRPNSIPIANRVHANASGFLLTALSNIFSGCALPIKHLGNPGAIRTKRMKPHGIWVCWALLGEEQEYGYLCGIPSRRCSIGSRLEERWRPACSKNTKRSSSDSLLESAPW